MATAALVGSTGLLGSHILTVLLESAAITQISALARRPLKVVNPSIELEPLIEADNSKWADKLSSISPAPTMFISSLGTSRARAGSLAGQRAIDYDLNLSLARAALASGVKTFVLISSAGVSKSSPFPYAKMKAELEEAVAELGFEHIIIVKPGMLMGTREDSRPVEAVFRTIAGGLKAVSAGALTNFWAQDVDVIARATVSAGLMSVEGKSPKQKVWFLEQSDIVKLGKYSVAGQGQESSAEPSGNPTQGDT